MDREFVDAIQNLANAVAGVGGSLERQAAAIVVLALVAVAGAYFSAYFKTRGQHAAITADLSRIEAQLKTQTAATETIKSEISKRGELHTLRMKKLEELMEGFLTTRDAYRAAFKTMLGGERAGDPRQAQHLVMLSHFYFPELQNPILAFVDHWGICLDDANRELERRISVPNKDIVPIMLELWRNEPNFLLDDAEVEGQEVELLLVQTMRNLLGEVAPREAGRPPT